MSSVVEQDYQAHLDWLSPQERIERFTAMLKWMRGFLARHLTAELGPMSDERLKWQAAKRMYGADPTVLALIERKLASVTV